MLWLFGQIWLWLLVAFALGVVTTVVVLRPRRKSVPSATHAEQTQVLPLPPDEYVDPEPEPDAGDCARGRRSGTLPIDWPPAS
ncbi:hypothetical protein LWP59_35930 [Amycolatopsis acidiphila]|uniref:Uncharacterized protein n=1 Tax=Amycolatopsis acidiphila TaxID=715473 RepID=A0A558A2R4_9PSEU|nr:hypothetical protein [Amycolatopsis acidiphila]TVT18547.1 hypothetical protein FNH06_27350 [Amycolatopsis acidiphila]UIJ59374.1 hypothetical protein LWP59_35930 [Amycolatopsis acidiphila]GHG79974.1 hypothetical protein GCM10017788_48750 [Amycolatopsis acidiphila]